jgi:hypothetical protein
MLIIKKYYFVFINFFIVNLILSVLSCFILPERYYNDTIIIIFDKYNEIGWVGSYPFTMMFYSFLFI